MASRPRRRSSAMNTGIGGVLLRYGLAHAPLYRPPPGAADMPPPDPAESPPPGPAESPPPGPAERPPRGPAERPPPGPLDMPPPGPADMPPPGPAEAPPPGPVDKPPPGPVYRPPPGPKYLSRGHVVTLEPVAASPDDPLRGRTSDTDVEAAAAAAIDSWVSAPSLSPGKPSPRSRALFGDTRYPMLSSATVPKVLASASPIGSAFSHQTPR
jgi:hypothetical protein